MSEKERMGRIGTRPRWAYLLSNPVRATHLVGAAVFLATYLLEIEPAPSAVYLLVTVGSGGLLLIVEWLRHPQLFREAAGVSTVVKLLLLGTAHHGFLPGPASVLVAFVLASLAAHAPKHIRHRLLF